MIKHLFIFTALFAALLFSGCSSDAKHATAAGTELKNFTIPDSIDKALIIAMYDETEPAGRTVLVYDDETRTTARKITWFAQYPVVVEKLAPLRYNEFTAPASGMEYVIKEKTLLSIYMGTNRCCNTSFNWTSDGKGGASNTREYTLLAKQ